MDSLYLDSYFLMLQDSRALQIIFFSLENIEPCVYEQTLKTYNCFDIRVGFAVGSTLL